MKKTILFLAVSIVLVGAAIAVEYHWSRHGDQAHGHTDHAQPAKHGSMMLNNGQRWATDGSLRTGMQRIHDALQQASPELAQTTREQVAYLIDNCKLQPQADAALHGVIAQLLAGADALEKNPAGTKGTEIIRHALQQYPEYFDHPGWQP